MQRKDEEKKSRKKMEEDACTSKEEPFLSSTYFLSCFDDRAIEGDILEKDNIVVPIKTEGRPYGSISNQFLRKHGDLFTRKFGLNALPDLKYMESMTMFVDFMKPPSPRKTVTFIAYWTDESTYTAASAARAVSSVMREFCLFSTRIAGRKSTSCVYIEWEDGDGQVLSIPLFAKANTSWEWIVAMEKELQDCEAALWNCCIPPCEVEVVVKDKKMIPLT